MLASVLTLPRSFLREDLGQHPQLPRNAPGFLCSCEVLRTTKLDSWALTCVSTSPSAKEGSTAAAGTRGGGGGESGPGILGKGQ